MGTINAQLPQAQCCSQTFALLTTVPQTVLPQAPSTRTTSYDRAPSGGAWVSSWGCLVAAAAAATSVGRAHRRSFGAQIGRGRQAASSRRRCLPWGRGEGAPSGEGSADAEVSRAASLRGGVLGGLGFLTLPAAPLPAAAKSYDEVKQTLKSYGMEAALSPDKVPDGWNVIMEPIGLVNDADYGKFNLGQEPIMVTFYSPGGWMATKPNIDFNGSAGTVQVNDYGKGDTGTLYVDTRPKKPLSEMTNPDYYSEMRRALTQKMGDAFLDKLTIAKIEDGPTPEYKLVNVRWELYTGTGLQVNRQGWASFCQIGDDKNLQVFWTGAQGPRWKTVGKDLKVMAQSFRASKIPPNIAQDLTESITKLVRETKY